MSRAMPWSNGTPPAVAVSAASIGPFVLRICPGPGVRHTSTSSSPVATIDTSGAKYSGASTHPTPASTPAAAGVSTLPAGTTTSPARISAPRRYTHCPGRGAWRVVTPSPTAGASSCITTASAPAGIGAPVKMRAHSPAPIAFTGTAPAGISSTTRKGASNRSVERTAYPSRSDLSNGGESRSAATSAAITAPVIPATD